MDDPEWWLVEATRFYHRALESNRCEVERQREKDRTQKRARIPTGFVVEHENRG